MYNHEDREQQEVEAIKLIDRAETFADQGKRNGHSPNQPEATATKSSEQTQVEETDAAADSIYASYHSKSWGKNPFYHNYRPSVGPAGPSKAEFHLMGIMFREMEAQALIDNRIVTVGDQLKGYRITEIARDSVVLDNGEKIIILRIQKETS